MLLNLFLPKQKCKMKIYFIFYFPSTKRTKNLSIISARNIHYIQILHMCLVGDLIMCTFVVYFILLVCINVHINAFGNMMLLCICHVPEIICICLQGYIIIFLFVDECLFYTRSYRSGYRQGKWNWPYEFKF